METIIEKEFRLSFVESNELAYEATCKVFDSNDICTVPCARMHFTKLMKMNFDMEIPRESIKVTESHIAKYEQKDLTRPQQRAWQNIQYKWMKLQRKTIVTEELMPPSGGWICYDISDEE